MELDIRCDGKARFERCSRTWRAFTLKTFSQVFATIVKQVPRARILRPRLSRKPGLSNTQRRQQDIGCDGDRRR